MSRLYRARQEVVRRVDGGRPERRPRAPAAQVGGSDEDLLAGRGLVAVGPLAGDGQVG